jgi:hypothetical protein
MEIKEPLEPITYLTKPQRPVMFTGKELVGGFLGKY